MKGHERKEQATEYLAGGAFLLPEEPHHTRSGVKEGYNKASSLGRSLRRTLIRAVILIAFSVMMFVGLCVMLYPSMSEYINAKNHSRVINSYEKSLAAMTDADNAEYLTQARAYNAKLTKAGLAVSDAFAAGEKNTDKSGDYWKLLNLDGSGVLGYIVIDKIQVKLPIYHGADEAVLEAGVGHIQGSSLPVGGESTHAVLSARTGLPSAQLFTNVDQLKVGDTFEIHVLSDILTYRVDQILVVEPSEVSALSIIPGGDYVTLVTCTPYGVNTKRLLVRGARTANAVKPAQTVSVSPERSKASGGLRLPAWLRNYWNQVVEGYSLCFEKLATGLVAAVEWGMRLLGIQY